MRVCTEKVQCVFLAIYRVKFNIDLSSNEMRTLFSIKFKKAYPHRQRKNKEGLEKVHERNFENSRNLPKKFQFG